MVMDLTGRIKMINLQHGVRPTAPVDEQAEDVAEDNLIAKAEEIWEEYKVKEESEQQPCKEVVAESCRGDFESVVLDKLDRIEERLDAHDDILNKINKHINSTQKMLKKGAK